MTAAAVVIGVGNADRGDDGAGPAVASRIGTRATPSVATVIREGDTTALVDDWAGVETAYVVDASHSGLRPGTVQRVELGDAPIGSRGARYSSHVLDVSEAIELARVLGRLPPRLIVFSVEGEHFGLGAGLSPPVEAATRAVAGRILDEIGFDGELRRSW